MDKYCLPDDYVHRNENAFFDDTPYRDEYQDEVYQAALEQACTFVDCRVLDIGTGSGFKLMKYFKDFNTTGVDIEPTLSFLKNKYPSRYWASFEDITGYYDLVICSDVIEHIPDADEFLQNILSIDFETIVFSTPDRESMYGGKSYGPPNNPAHVREWTMKEFNCYISKYFYVLNHIKVIPNTQICICRKK